MDAATVFSTVSGRFKILYETGKAIDFEIVCDDRSWKVHRFVLCLYSDVLACACDGGFGEASVKRLNLSADGEDCVDALVRYIYYFDYASPRSDNIYTSHVNAAILADKYDLPNLVKLANMKLADLLAKVPIKFTTNLIDAATLAEEATGPMEDFRAALAKAAVTLSKTNISDYVTLMKALPNLAQSVAVQLAAELAEMTLRNAQPTEFYCQACNMMCEGVKMGGKVRKKRVI
ncbi:hypothetical protein B0A48_14440 [Cryoendolithus antarcticus]|uniref:BTB domain-containing protein n=1 Tax=Cryoendolithus antarcticus TaxID=1507870 RepID=A0A1V8SJY9_9PEZI|nr:hypothetical protein B0A48_14440 [Cryoendolithus antarcticus]